MVALPSSKPGPDVEVPVGPPVPGLAEVLSLALVEAQRYGSDDTIWIRELVQNARDAGARNIWFTLEADAVAIEDDGSGMSRSVVGDQLLRLFSSSKDRDRGAAGCFGVGFWSVLRARPSTIEVDSHDGEAGVSIVIDVERGTIEERVPARSMRGTRVRLVSPSPTFSRATLRAAIDHHAAMVDGRDGPAPQLLLRGPGGLERLNRPFSLEGVSGVVASAPVSGAGFAGFIGLSTAPHVELFHHGLRVVEATSLSTLVPSLKRRPRRGLGLVMRVDAPGLKVLVDRRTVVEDDVVRALVSACDAAAARLERAVLDDAAPLPLFLRMLDAIGRAVTRPGLRRLGAFALALAVGLGGGLLVLRELRPDLRLPWNPQPALPHVPATPRVISDAIAGLGAPRIDVLGQSPAGFALATRHIANDLLAIDVRSRPDAMAGLRPAAPGRGSPVGEGVAGPIVATAQLRAAGTTVLPSSLQVWPAEASSGGVSLPIRRNGDGLPTVDVPDAPNGVTVDVFFGVAPPRQPELLQFAWAPALAPFVAVAGDARDLDAVRRIGAAVARGIRYSTATVDADRFNADPRPLVERAIALGVGDCDVINTVYVRALQQAGLPALLARGFVVRDDAIATELHAWGEVFVDGAWHMVDASPPSAMPVPTTGGPPAAPRPADAPDGDGLQPTAAPPETAQHPMTLVRPPPTEARASSTPSPLLALAALAALAVAVAAFATVLRQRRGSQNRLAREDVIALVVTGLQSGAAEHLGLLERPILPTDDGVISLARAHALAARGRLAVSRGGRRHPALHRRVRVIDGAGPWAAALRPFLPRLVDLEGIKDALDNAGHSPSGDSVIGALQERIDRSFSAVALRPTQAAGLREVHLCTRDGRTHQILLGPDVRAAPAPALWSRLVDEATSLWMLRTRG